MGGISPAHKRNRLGNSAGRINSSNSHPTQYFRKAEVIFHPEQLMATRPAQIGVDQQHALPVAAKATARFTETVVLPSCGEALVISVVRGGAPARDSRSAVRNIRKASPTGE